MRAKQIIWPLLILSLSSQAAPLVPKPAIDSLLTQKAEGNFPAFLKNVNLGPNVKRTVGRFLQNRPLNERGRHAIHRLLGIYVRLRYEQDALQLLERMVAIPTFRRDDVPQHQNPAIKKFGQLMAEVGKELKLPFRNVDDRIFEFELKGSGSGETLGIYTHADVVPAIVENWVLDDETKLHPFKMKVINGKIYGRGTEDDKASIAAALMAMKAIREHNIQHRRSIRLMIETTEETGGEGFDYYKKNNKIPEYNIVLDSSYPAVVAEKGFGVVSAQFPLQQAGFGNEIEQISGGTAVNQIPAVSVAKIRSIDAEGLRQKIEYAAKLFIEKHGKDFSISTQPLNSKKGKKGEPNLLLTVHGTSAHSSAPQSGVNPVSRMLLFIHKNRHLFSHNHYTEAARYIADNWGLDNYGRRLKIDYKDEFMGPLTSAITYLAERDGKLDLQVNLRVPRPREVKELEQEIRKKLDDYWRRSKINASAIVRIGPWMYRNPKGPWLEALLTIFRETTGLEARPVSSSGGTTAKKLPNAINFGPSMPGQKYTGHTANEFKRIENLRLDMQMFTEMMVRIANLRRL